MSLPNPSMSFTAFDILTAAEMNDLVENIEALSAGTGFNPGVIPTTAYADGSVTPVKMSNIYKFSAYRSTAWNTPANNTATVVFNNELFDTNNNYNNSTGEYTAPLTGTYCFHTWAGWTGSANSVIRFYVNGTEETYGILLSAGANASSAFLSLTAGDVVTSRLFTASAQTGSTTRQLSRFSGFLVP